MTTAAASDDDHLRKIRAKGTQLKAYSTARNSEGRVPSRRTSLVSFQKVHHPIKCYTTGSLYENNSDSPSVEVGRPCTEPVVVGETTFNAVIDGLEKMSSD